MARLEQNANTRPKQPQKQGSRGQHSLPSDEKRALLREMRKTKRGKGKGEREGMGWSDEEGGVETEEETEEEVDVIEAWWESEGDDEGGIDWEGDGVGKGGGAVGQEVAVF